MEGAFQIEATIETLLFSDGEVVGPNETHYDTQVENRKMAAVTLASEVRSATAKGQDKQTVLLNVPTTQPDREASSSCSIRITPHLSTALWYISLSTLGRGRHHALEKPVYCPRYYCVVGNFCSAQSDKSKSQLQRMAVCRRGGPLGPAVCCLSCLAHVL
jgi:hypothetical protein